MTWGSGGSGELGLGSDRLKTDKPAAVDTSVLSDVWYIAAGVRACVRALF
jgi:alpha-tubulin suppressor-like RCC1 family protein